MRAKYYFLFLSIIITSLISFQKSAFSQCAVLPPVLSQGSNKFPNGLCSPVTADLQYQITFASALVAGSTYRLTYEWGDGTPNTVVILPAGQASYNVTQNHPFPVASDCEYRVLMTISVNGAACINTRQQQIISTWRTDAFNGGNVQLISPTTNTTIHEVCEGVNIDVIFNDLTNFNCNSVYPANYPPAGPIQTPNEQVRWQQIVYNTPGVAAGPAKIPNVAVNAVPTTNGTGGNILANYQDTRGVFMMTPLVVLNDGRRRPSLRLTAPGGFGAGFPVAGQEYEITIRYWNTCNPYDNPAIAGPPADVINGDSPPVERTARIRIITAPNAPVVPNREICEGESRTLSVTAPLGAGFTYRWWNHPTNRVIATNQVQTGTTFTPSSAQAPAGVRSHFWVTVESTATGGCRSNSTEVTLTRRSTLPQPAAITGPVNLCPSTTGNVFSVPAFVPNDPPVIGFTDPTDAGPDPDFTLNTEYEWLVPAGWTITAGQGTRQITVTTGTTVGAGTVTTRLRYTTNTASTASRCLSPDRTLAVNLRARPTASVAPNPVNICEGTAVQLNATPVLPASGGGFNPTISAHTWSGNTAILDNATVEDPNILTTTNDGTYNVGYIVTADFGGSIFCSSAIVNVPVNISDNPGAATVGANQAICFAAGPLVSTSLGGNTPSAGTGTWSQVSGPGTTTFSGGVNNPSATATVTQNGIYVFRWRIVSGTCTSDATITVDYGTTPPVSNAGTAQDVCSATRTTLLAGNDPTFATGTWTQVSGPGSTTFVNDHLRNTSITASAFGTYVYQWTIASGSCPSSSSTVQVIFQNPPVVDAMPNFSTCADNPPTAAFHIPITGTFGGGASQAQWVIVSGTGTLASGAFDASSPVDDTYRPSAGDYTAGTVTLRLITNDPAGQCIAVQDDVIITLDRRPAAPVAGPAFSVCGPSATMAATPVNTAVTPGAIGTWTGPGGVTFVNANSPTTVVNGLSNGPNVLRWTVTTATGVCAAQFAEVTITRNTLPNNNVVPFAKCVDVPGGTTAVVALTELQALNDLITGITGSANRTIEFYENAARTDLFDATETVANAYTVYTRVIRTDVTPNCPTDGTLIITVNQRPGVTPHAPEFCEDLPVGSNTHAGINLTSYNNIVKNSVAANTVAWFTNAARTIPVPTPTNVTANNGTKFYALITNPTTTCSDTTSIRIIVNPRPVPNPLIGPTNVCVDASSAIVYQLQTNNVGLGYSYSWTIPAPPFVQMLGGTSSDYLVLMNFPTIVNPGQNISVTEISDKGCPGDPNIINVAVETSPPPIVITSTSGTGPGGTGPFAVCESQAGVVFTVANLANTTYAWTVPAGSSVISGQGTNQITVNFGVVPGVIAVTPTTTTGCAGSPANGSVAINPRPSLDALANSVCSDTPGEITLSGTGAASFNITNVSISAGLSPASRPTGNGLAPNAIYNDVFTNATGGPLLVQYTVVPVSAQGCTGDPRIVNLTIQPEPVLNPNLSDAVCSGTEDVNIVLGVAVGSAAASHYRIVSINNPDPTNVTQVAGVQAIPGDYNANILTDDRWRNVGTTPITLEYMVHPVSSGGCIGDPAIPVRVTVYPEPHVASASQTICSGDIPSIILTTSPLITGSTFTWTVKSTTGVITGATSGTGSTITNVLVNNDVTPGTVTYEVRATGDASVGGCQGPPTDVVITVNPAPLTTNVDQRICSTSPGGTTYTENLINLQPDINADGSLIFSWHTTEVDAIGNANAMSVATASAYPLANGIPVFVRVSNGSCARVMAVTYTVDPTPSFAATITSNYNGAQLSCNTSNNGIITVTAPPTNGTAPYLYSIDGGTSYFTSLTFNGLSATGNPYTVQVRDARGCIAQSGPLNFVAPPVLAATPAITSNFNGQHIRCHGDNNGEVTVTATGGTVVTTYSYSILELPGNTTGATSGIFTGLTAGSYTFVVRDANNCSVTTSTITLIDPPSIIATAVLTSPVVCFGESNGVITVTATGGTLTGPTYTYTISPGGATNTTGVFNGLAAGTYVVNVTDNNTCVRSSNSVTVTQPSALTAFASVTSNYHGAKISCPGANDAVITVTANGGNGGYGYVLVEAPTNTSGNTNGIYTGVGPGNYTVRVTDSQNCTLVTVPVNITEPLPIDASATIIQNITCNGATDGQIRVTAIGGTGAYSYQQITPAGLTNATGIFTGLGNGTYDFRVTDLNGCSDVVQIILNQPTAVTASAVVGNSYNGAQLSCHNSSDGVITVTASGGTGALHYVFDQFALTNTTGSTSGVFTGVPAGINYTFTVRDANNCTIVTVPVTVTPPTAIVASGSVTSNINGQHISCPTATDGRITITATGGTGVYTYRIDQLPLNTTGQSSGVFTGIGAGTYTATVRDANNCFVVTTSITVVPPPAVTASAAITSNHNGRHISCFGANDGTITITAGGGVTPYSFVLNENPTNVTGATSGIFTGLTAGTYTVTVTDLNGCPVGTSPVTLTQPAVLAANGAVTSNYNGQQISCFGASDGRIQITATGGTGAYNYVSVEVPANVTGATSGIFTGLPAGSYTFRVTDVNTCLITTTAVVISSPTAVTASALVTSNYSGSQISCTGASDGIITVTASGGTGVLHYVFVENPTNISGASSGIFTGVAAGGPYTFTVTDVNGCPVTTTPVTITPPVVLAASGAVTSNHNGHHISCPTSTDGQITITATGGTGAYTYRIDQLPLNTTGLNNGIFTGIGVGSYTATVRDANGCFIVTLPITVIPPPAVTATAAVTSNHNGRQISCFGANDGQITVTPGGGVGPYSFVLNQDLTNTTGATTGIFTGLVAGTYTITVTDQNSCPVVTAPVTISQPAVVAATAAVTSNYNGSQIRCLGASDGIIRVTPTGGTTPYTYSLVEIPANVTGASTGIFTGLPAGTYTFNVEDVNGCSIVTAPVTITPPTQVTAAAAVTSNYNTQHISCNGVSDGQITVTASGGTGDLRYVFNQFPANQSGQFSGIFSGVPAGTGYTFTVTDVNGCSIVTTPIDVIQPPAITASGIATSNYNGFNISCFTETDGQITITASGGNGTLTYMLLEDAGNTSGLTSGVFDNLRAGSFRARITDSNNCSFTTAPIIVTQPANLTIAIAKTSNYNGYDVSCDGAADGQISVTSTTGGSGGYTYVLNEDPANVTGLNSGVFTGLVAGLYSVTVTDANLCQRGSIPVFLSNPIPLFEGIIGLDKQVCDGVDPTIFTQLAAPLGGIGNYTYQWQDSVAGGAWNNIALAQSALYDPPIIAQTTYYRRLVSSGTCVTLASNVVTVTVNPLPEVVVKSFDPYVCEGQPMILFYEFTQGQAPYYFSYTSRTFDQNLPANVIATRVVTDELSGTEKPIIVSPFVDDMDFTVTNVRDFNGCVATVASFPAPVFVEVLKTKADFTVISPDPQCSESTFTVQWNAESDVQYTWEWPDDFDEVRGDGLTGVQTASRMLKSQNPSGIQTLPIILNAENTMHLTNPAIPSCPTATNIKNIRIYPAILPNIVVNPEEVCSNTPIRVQNNTLGGSTHRWTITQDPDAVHGAPQVLSGYPITRTSPLSESFVIRNQTTANPMEYSILYEIANSGLNGNCAKDTTVRVRVYRENIADVEPAAGSNFVFSTPPKVLAFDNLSTPVIAPADFDYTWVFSNNNVNTPAETRLNPTPEGQQSYAFMDPGPGKRVTLTVVNRLALANGLPNGCATTDLYTFELTMIQPVAAFTPTPEWACLPATIEVENQSTGSAVINDWKVYDANNNLVTSALNQVEPTFQLNTEGTYTIILEVRAYAEAPISTDIKTVRVFENPVAGFITSPNKVVFVPDQELFTINRGVSRYPAIDNPTYEWDFGDGSIYTEAEPVHKYNIEGNYIIVSTIIDTHKDGLGNVMLVCKDTAQHSIQARASGFVNVPNAFTPNKGGPTGGYVDNTGLTLNDVFLPSTKGVREFHMQIFDRWGNMVFETKEQNRGWDGYDRNGNLLPSGVYVYKLVLRMANEQRITQVGDVTLIR